MRLSLAAARKYALINGIIIRTRAIYRIHGKHSKSVWWRRCVPDWECCQRSPYLQEATIPYCLRGPSTVYTWRQKW